MTSQMGSNLGDLTVAMHMWPLIGQVLLIISRGILGITMPLSPNELSSGKD